MQHKIGALHLAQEALWEMEDWTDGNGVLSWAIIFRADSTAALHAELRPVLWM